MPYTTSQTTFKRSPPLFGATTTHHAPDKTKIKKDYEDLQKMRTSYYLHHLMSNNTSKLYTNVDIYSTNSSEKFTSHNPVQEIYKKRRKTSRNAIPADETLRRTETYHLIISPCKNRSAQIVLDKFEKLRSDNSITTFPKVQNANLSKNPEYHSHKYGSRYKYFVNNIPDGKFELPSQLCNKSLRKKDEKRCSKCCCPVLPVAYQDIPKRILQKRVTKPPKFKCEETQTSPRKKGEKDPEIILNVIASKSEEDVCIGLKMKDRGDEEMFIRCQKTDDISVSNCIKYFEGKGMV